MILCRRPLWMASEQKKNSKVKHGLCRPTNSNSYSIDSLQSLITDKESMVIGYHDHL